MTYNLLQIKVLAFFSKPYIEALNIVQRTFDKDHPQVAQLLSNLASLYYKQERYEEAESLYLQALKLKRKYLGNGHPDLVLNLNNLAFLYQVQKKYVESISLYSEAIDIANRNLGAEHPHTSMAYKGREKAQNALTLLQKT